jgi:hypothetical protein
VAAIKSYQIFNQIFSFGNNMLTYLAIFKRIALYFLCTSLIISYSHTPLPIDSCYLIEKMLAFCVINMDWNIIFSTSELQRKMHRNVTFPQRICDQPLCVFLLPKKPTKIVTESRLHDLKKFPNLLTHPATNRTLA